jgi:hypothetical protein
VKVVVCIGILIIYYTFTDSLACLGETLLRCEKEKQAFFKQLEPFPNMFQLQGQHTLGERNYRNMRSSLESALLVGYQTNIETARAR